MIEQEIVRVYYKINEQPYSEKLEELKLDGYKIKSIEHSSEIVQFPTHYIIHYCDVVLLERESKKLLKNKL